MSVPNGGVDGGGVVGVVDGVDGVELMVLIVFLVMLSGYHTRSR